MRYVAAYMLAALGGNDKPSAKDIKAILESVGVGIEEENLNFVISQLSGKNLTELMAEGSKKLATLSLGGGGGVAPVAESKAKPEAAPKEAAKPKEEEEKAESDEDMGFGLFD